MRCAVPLSITQGPSLAARTKYGATLGNGAIPAFLMRSSEQWRQLRQLRLAGSGGACRRRRVGMAAVDIRIRERSNGANGGFVIALSAISRNRRRVVCACCCSRRGHSALPASRWRCPHQYRCRAVMRGATGASCGLNSSQVIDTKPEIRSKQSGANAGC